MLIRDYGLQTQNAVTLLSNPHMYHGEIRYMDTCKSIY